MNKRLKVAMAITAGLVLFGLVFLVCFMVVSHGRQSSLVTRERYDLIDVGMTQAELEIALGPPRNEFSNPVTIWAPQGNGTVVSAEFSPGTTNVRFFPNAGTPDQNRETVWLSKSGLIAATFDDEGRLQDKYFSTVHDAGRPSVMDWLRSRKEAFRRGPGEASQP